MRDEWRGALLGCREDPGVHVAPFCVSLPDRSCGPAVIRTLHSDMGHDNCEAGLSAMRPEPLWKSTSRAQPHLGARSCTTSPTPGSRYGDVIPRKTPEKRGTWDEPQ